MDYYLFFLYTNSYYIRFCYLVKRDTLGKIYKPPKINPYYDTNDSSDYRKWMTNSSSYCII